MAGVRGLMGLQLCTTISGHGKAMMTYDDGVDIVQYIHEVSAPWALTPLCPAAR